MSEFRLPAETEIGHVHLQIADLDRSLTFYQDLLGFQRVSQDGTAAMLSATGRPPHQIALSERPGAIPKPPRTTGLYHTAIRFPTRRALAQTFQRLVKDPWPFQGFADHTVSEALYLADPDGNGLELYADRPRERWPRPNGQIEMGIDPLDVEDLLAEASGGAAPWTGMHPGTDIGHVHLQVSDLARAEDFYNDLLGLDVTLRGYPGALFLSAGGYHHHLGLNVWAGVGAPPAPPGAAGLVSFALLLPGRGAWNSLLVRLKETGVRIEDKWSYENGGSVLVRDPDGNGVELLVYGNDTGIESSG
jgi:catechol 2,3-dioxygenase